MRHSFLLFGIWGFFSGIFLVSAFSVPAGFSFAVLSISLALFAYFIFAREARIFFAVAFFVFFASLGMLRYSHFRSWQGDEKFLASVGQKITVEGIVAREPDVKENYTRLIVLVDATNILVYDDAYSERKYGDKILVTGKLAKPENFESGEGRTFDYVSYLAKERVFYEMRYASIEHLSSGHGNFLKRASLAFKKHFTDSIERSLPYLEAKLASGLTIAGKHALPKNIQDEFVKTGTAQVVVLSGYNVTIIADTVMKLLSFLPLFAGLGASAFLIVMFAFATGGSATIVRAVIMSLVALLGKALRRKYSAGRALIITAFLMLVHNPMLLAFDASFQLSFIATAGLIYATPIAQFYIGTGKIKDILSSTIATQIFVSPFVLYLTGVFSVVALPANIIVSFFVPIAMLASFITGFLGFISELFALPFGFVAFVFLKSILATVHIFSLIPSITIAEQYSPAWGVAGVYICYAVLLIRFYRKGKDKIILKKL